MGTSDNVKPVMFGDGCTGCKYDDAAYPLNLTWLWIVLGCLGGGFLIFFVIMCCMKGSNKRTADQILLADNDN